MTLLQYKANPNSIRKGATHHEGSAEIVRDYLVTPVYYAAQTGKGEILKLLLNSGGSVTNIKPSDPNQGSPLAETMVTTPQKNPIVNAETIKILLKHKANMHDVMPANYTPEKFADNCRPSILEYAITMSMKENGEKWDSIVKIFYEFYLDPAGNQIEFSDFKEHFFALVSLKVLASNEKCAQQLFELVATNEEMLNIIKESNASVI